MRKNIPKVWDWMLPKEAKVVGEPLIEKKGSKEKRFIISPMRIGDALASVHFLEDARYENWVLANRYNQGVWDFIYRGADLNFQGYIVLPLGGPEGEGDYTTMALAMAPKLCTEVRVVYPRVGYLRLIRIPLKVSFPHSSFPGTRITLQTGSVSPWKGYNELGKADLARIANGIPIYNFSTGKEVIHPGASKELKNLPLIEVAAIMRGAKLHIGVMSSLVWLAPMLGTPAVMCSSGNGLRNWGVTRFGGRAYGGDGKRPGKDLKGSKDLFRATAKEIEAAVEAALKFD